MTSSLKDIVKGTEEDKEEHEQHDSSINAVEVGSHRLHVLAELGILGSSVSEGEERFGTTCSRQSSENDSGFLGHHHPLFPSSGNDTSEIDGGEAEEGNAEETEGATEDEFIMKVLQERMREHSADSPGTEPQGIPTQPESTSNAQQVSTQPQEPGAYFAAPGMRGLQRAESLNLSLFDSSSEFSLGPLESDNDEELGLSPAETCTGTVGNSSPTEETDATPSDTDNHGGLAVADMVEEDLPHAENYNVQNQDTTRQEKTKQAKIRIILGVMALAMIIIILAAVFLVVDKGATPHTPELGTELQTNYPSESPVNPLEKKIKPVLFKGNATLALGDADSPQFRAYQWLLEDSDHLPTYSDERIMQKFALASLYFATDGNGWEDNTNWLNHSIHECSWINMPSFSRKHVTSFYLPGYLDGFLEPPPSTPCDEDGLYQHLWLDQNNLMGFVPTEFFMLTTLKTLSMGRNQIDGTISSMIGKLTRLEGLALGQLPPKGVIPTEVGLLTNLNVLFLGRNQLQGTIPSELWKLTNLVDVVLFGNPELGGTIPTEISAFSKLRWLILDQSGFSGTIPTEIGQIKSLEWLVIAENSMTGNLPSEIGQLSKLMLISAWDNWFEGALPTEFGLLSSMFLARLDKNQFSGQVPSELGLLASLEDSLDLRDNLFSGVIPTQLGFLTRLQELEFSNNQFSGQIPSELGQLTNMVQLIFANNSISGTVPQELSPLQGSLYMLKLVGNPGLSGTVPVELCTINATCTSTSVNECGDAAGLAFDCSSLLCGCGCLCSHA
ncbi:Leucine Rich Repeat [Seminavis robusta]|uniref:Leucine Rich Repeat n=1 Tax=Seminavis robusta TaxID=568900 RepID=A0A9N8HWP9_9STRA|nr:Leucine Rich Repeat [Seminavis robusta]|eukprot:Sro2273_g321510.1 Leucine Rich Repeat (783) ;mRNA; f:4888-7330